MMKSLALVNFPVQRPEDALCYPEVSSSPIRWGEKETQQLTKEQTIIGNPQGQQRQLAVVFDAAIAFKGAVYTW